jgi:hypothetical protein
MDPAPAGFKRRRRCRGAGRRQPGPGTDHIEVFLSLLSRSTFPLASVKQV